MSQVAKDKFILDVATGFLLIWHILTRIEKAVWHILTRIKKGVNE